MRRAARVYRGEFIHGACEFASEIYETAEGRFQFSSIPLIQQVSF